LLGGGALRARLAARLIWGRAASRTPFWERYGYHSEADYWKEQRYGF
jgi:DMSO/TMAO reductase YedYZ molybdopterin-dependent catalytic subunit